MCKRFTILFCTTEHLSKQYCQHYTSNSSSQILQYRTILILNRSYNNKLRNGLFLRWSSEENCSERLRGKQTTNFLSAKKGTRQLWRTKSPATATAQTMKINRTRTQNLLGPLQPQLCTDKLKNTVLFIMCAIYAIYKFHLSYVEVHFSNTYLSFSSLLSK